jgi:hypothetical protein
MLPMGRFTDIVYTGVYRLELVTSKIEEEEIR